MNVVGILYFIGPPNSPPTRLFLRMSNTIMQIKANIQNIVTEKPKLPGLT
jgi:hypothetical protein